MSASLNLDDDFYQSKNREMLEKGIGKWTKEFRFTGPVVWNLVSFPFILAFLFIFLIISPYAGNSSQNILDLFSERPFYLFLYLFIFVSTITLMIVIHLLVPWSSRNTRCYTVFKILTPSTEISEFSLSNFVTFLSFTRLAKHVNSQSDFLPTKEHDSSSSSATNNFQFNTFEMVRKKYTFRDVYMHSFAIASYENGNGSDTFVFYSRHYSDWDFIKKRLQASGFTVETVGYRKMRV